MSFTNLFKRRRTRASRKTLTPIILNTLAICALSGTWNVSDHFAYGTPRMALTAGTPCSGCHYSPNGGGGRTELGWSSMSHVGALTYDTLGLKSLHDQESNHLAGDLMTLGVDIRLQGARLGTPQINETSKEVEYPDFSWIPMQFQPYLALQPTYGLTLYGSVMPGPNFAEGDISTQVFPGMHAYEAWAMYSFGATAPSIRIGQFQPTVGIRHDDHTMLLRGNASNRRIPLLPPNYNELGAEIGYQPQRWLRTEVGAFYPKHLLNALEGHGEAVNLSPVVASARVTFLPQFTFGGAEKETSGDDDFGDDFGDDFDTPSAPPPSPTVLNTWFGSSAYWSDEFLMVNGFMGLGLSNGLSMVSEVMWRSNSNIEYDKYHQLNTMLGLNYMLKEWAVINTRVERAQTHSIDAFIDEVAVTWQFVAGLEFYPLPYIEIRPEYRLVDTFDYPDSYRFGQATIQVHLFY